MPGEEGIPIRAYRAGDRAGVLALDLETGFFGESMSVLVDAPELFTRPLARIVDRMPDLCFVAEQNGAVAGYVAGFAGSLSLDAVARAGDLVRDLLRIPFLSNRDRRYLFSRLRFSLRALVGEERRFRTPAGPRLHVNVRESLRGTGAGSGLLSRLTDELRRRGFAHVHANSYQTARNDTRGFWTRNGFREYCRVRTSVWRDVIDDPVDLVCWVRELR